MGAQPQFDATHWLATYCFGGAELRDEAKAAVSDFALMWNVFEGALFDAWADVPKMKNLAHRLCEHGCDMAQLDFALEFWTDRYWSGKGFTHHFDGLEFRAHDQRATVEAVLRRETLEPKDKLLAVMVIIYRLRNNLFHGLKTVASLNTQTANLNVACRSLAAIMQIAKVDLVRAPRRA